jgi:hypothetical protein
LLGRAAMEEAGWVVCVRESRVLKDEGEERKTYERRRALTGSRRTAGTDIS